MHVKWPSLSEVNNIKVTWHHKIVVITSQTGDKQKEELLANPKSETQLQQHDKLGNLDHLARVCYDAAGRHKHYIYIYIFHFDISVLVFVLKQKSTVPQMVSTKTEMPSHEDENVNEAISTELPIHASL